MRLVKFLGRFAVVSGPLLVALLLVPVLMAATESQFDLIFPKPQVFQAGIYIGNAGANPQSQTANKITKNLCTVGQQTTSFGTVAANTCAVTTATITGALLGDQCQFSLPVAGAPAVGLQYECYVSAANTITMQVCNATAAGVASGNPNYTACITSSQ